jgi:predicted phosphohydrolase
LPLPQRISIGNRSNMTSPSVSLAWATDIHLDHSDPDRTMEFLHAIKTSPCDGVLLSGDMSNAMRIEDDLTMMADSLDKPVFFVLGNHDYYGGSIAGVRRIAENLSSPRMHWLAGGQCIDLAPGVGMVGNGGWGDAQYGNCENTPVMLTDYFIIAELKDVYDRDNDDMSFRAQPALKEKLRALGREAAEDLRPQLKEAADRFSQVIVLTHVPPFKEAAWHEGAHSSDDWLPGFTCKAVGEELVKVAEAYTDTTFTVLCGHTHGEGIVRMLPNLVVHTQAALYGSPGFQIVKAGSDGISVNSQA